MLEDVKNLIQENLKDAQVEIFDMTGTNDHLAILVASNNFEGKSLIEQHQILMDILKVPLSDKLHAVKLKTMTLDKYKKSKENV